MKKTQFLLIILITSFKLVYSQELISYNSLANDECSNINTITQNISGLGICRGPGIKPAIGGTYNSNFWTRETTLDPDDYLEWSITPNTYYELNLTNMAIRYDRSKRGPTTIDLQIDSGNGFVSVFTDNTISEVGDENIKTIDLSAYTEITNTITFRLYAFGSGSALGTFDIEAYAATNKGIIINGTASITNASVWTNISGVTDWSNGIPSTTTNAIISEDYNTLTHGNITANTLTITEDKALTLANNTFINIEKDVTINGNLQVEPQGALVQNSNTSTFSLGSNGTAVVNKKTTPLNSVFEYTYWSSPIKNITIQDAFATAHSWRRYWFNASNFLDEFTEIGNTNTFTAGADGIDDDGDVWSLANNTDIMTPGRGYIAMHNPIGFINGTQYTYSFKGVFNNGIIKVPIAYNGANGDKDWNLIGNPYPSAIDANLFLADNNTVLGGSIYLWSQNTAPSASTSGNENQNFSQADYAIITNGSGNTAGGDKVIPNSYIPSGQSFFAQGLSNGNAIFSNKHRMADETSNAQFFKNSNTQANRLWVNLTSDNGVFNQILMAYVNGATDARDSNSYDVQGRDKTTAAIIYTTIDTNRFIIQGKKAKSLTLNENIALGFETAITVPTIYRLSIPKLEGDFFENNTIFLNDNLQQVTHNLSESDYAFSSEEGHFSNRFNIVFINSNLSTERYKIINNNVMIIELENNQVKFNYRGDSTITSVTILDALGRELNHFRGSENNTIFNLSHIKNTAYIARIELANGIVINKKAVKK